MGWLGRMDAALDAMTDEQLLARLAECIPDFGRITQAEFTERYACVARLRERGREADALRVIEERNALRRQRNICPGAVVQQPKQEGAQQQ